MNLKLMEQNYLFELNEDLSKEEEIFNKSTRDTENEEKDEIKSKKKKKLSTKEHQLDKENTVVNKKKRQKQSQLLIKISQLRKRK